MFNRKDAIVYRKQYFVNGFLFKDFPYKQLQSDNVKATIEEVQNFANSLDKNKGETENDDNDSLDGDELIRKTFLTAGSSEVNKGDKIIVIKGDIVGVKGVVTAIEQGDVIFKSDEIDGNLRINCE